MITRYANRLSSYIVVIILFSFACASGLSSEERAAMQAARDAEIAAAQDSLESEIQDRIANGDTMPERVNNPDNAVAECISPSPPENAVVLNTGFVAASFICENAAAGKKVVDWRAWYCKDKDNVRACVLGRWPNGIPSYSGVPTKGQIVDLGGGNRFEFGPPKWTPENN